MSMSAEKFQDIEEPELEMLEPQDALDTELVDLDEVAEVNDPKLGNDSVDEEDNDRARNSRYRPNKVDSGDPVQSYLKQIGKVALLTAIEEVEISKRIEAGLYARALLNDTENRKSLIADTQGRPRRPTQEQLDLSEVARDGELAKKHLNEANLRLVVSIAKRYQGRGVDLLDLIQEGNLGLIRGIEKFDYAKGYKFSTYATWWIRQAVTRGLADTQRTIRVPIHMVEKINKVGKAKRDMVATLNREPTDEELSEETGFTVENIKYFAKVGKDPISLDFPVGDDSNSTIGDYVADTVEDDIETAVETTHMNQYIHDNLHYKLKRILNERQYEVIVYRYGLDGYEKQTLDIIGARLKPQISRERVRQIEAAAIKKIQGVSGVGVRKLFEDIVAKD